MRVRLGGLAAALTATAAAIGVTAGSAWDLGSVWAILHLSVAAHGLRTLLLWACLGAALAIYGAMVSALAGNPGSPGCGELHWRYRGRAEAIWTVIPALILIAMAIPAVKMGMERASGSSGDGETTRISVPRWEVQGRSNDSEATVAQTRITVPATRRSGY
jgi:cytochrome c oxidase subunit 2